MTLLSMVTPLVAALALAALVAATHRRLPPVLATRVLSITLGIVLVAAVPTLWLVSVGYLTHLPLLSGQLAWCAEILGIHEPIPHPIGLLALVVTVFGAVRMARVLRAYRQFRCSGHGPVEIAEHPRSFAYTLPGKAGRVVVSTGLLDLLDEREVAVVVAHEQAHGRHRHDRFLLTAQLAVAVMPIVRPLARRLQFTIERWADEVAARHCGDRSFVARTLGKVALSDASPVGVAAFAGLGVPARVAALLGPTPTRPHSGVILSTWAAVSATAVLAALQLHHLGVLLAAACMR